MKNTSTFNINVQSISEGISNIFNKIQKTNVKIVSKAKKQYISLPLIIAIIITCILPFIVITGVIIMLILDSDIVFERQMEEINRIDK